MGRKRGAAPLWSPFFEIRRFLVFSRMVEKFNLTLFKYDFSSCFEPSTRLFDIYEELNSTTNLPGVKNPLLDKTDGRKMWAQRAFGWLVHRTSPSSFRVKERCIVDKYRFNIAS